jgi:hypothetical protein
MPPTPLLIDLEDLHLLDTDALLESNKALITTFYY